MTDDEKVMLVETTERSKSNTHQIEEVKIKLEKLEEKTEDIHTIATSIQLISQDMNYMKKGQEDLSTKVDNLSDKVDSQIKEIKSDVETKVGNVNDKVDKLKLEPLEEMKKDKHDIKIDVVKQGIGYIIALLGGAFITLIANGTIKL